MSRPALLSVAREVGGCTEVALPELTPSSSRKRLRKTPSLAASLSAIISASQDERATLTCFLLAQEIAAWLYVKT